MCRMDYWKPWLVLNFIIYDIAAVSWNKSVSNQFTCPFQNMTVYCVHLKVKIVYVITFWAQQCYVLKIYLFKIFLFFFKVSLSVELRIDIFSKLFFFQVGQSCLSVHGIRVSVSLEEKSISDRFQISTIPHVHVSV